MSARSRDLISATLISAGVVTAGEIHMAAASTGAFQTYWRDWFDNDRWHSSTRGIFTGYDAMTNNRNDVLLLSPGDHSLSSGVTWAYNQTHMIGCSPTLNQPRVDIWQTTETTFSPMITLSGRGCTFANMVWRHGRAATDLICMTLSGRYNQLRNVYFMTPSTAGQDVASYQGVVLSGHGNHLHRCHIGSNGISRDQANCNVYLQGNGNVFDDCFFDMFSTGTTAVFVELETTDDRRYTLFKKCIFYSHSENNTIQIAAAVKHSGTAFTANMIFDPNCMFINVDTICASADEGFVFVPQTYNTTDLTLGQVGIAYDAD